MIKKSIGNKLHQYTMTKCPCGCEIKRLVRNDRRIKSQIFVKGHHHFNKGLTFNKLSNRWYVQDRENISVSFSRVVVECILKRQLKSDEIVHHINGDSGNDIRNNLLVCTKEYHNFLHKQMRKFPGYWRKDRSYLNIIQ